MTERTHLLDQRPMVFEGRPHVWYPNHESLPPAPEPAKKPTYVFIPPLYGGANRELPEDILGMTTAQAIQTLVERGWRNVDIANALDVDDNYVAGFKNRSKKQRSEAPAPATATPVIHREPVSARAHFVLDWQVRMSKWVFQDNYTHRKLGRRPKVFLLEHDALGQRFLWKATEINPKPRTSKSPFK